MSIVVFLSLLVTIITSLCADAFRTHSALLSRQQGYAVTSTLKQIRLFNPHPQNSAKSTSSLFAVGNVAVVAATESTALINRAAKNAIGKLLSTCGIGVLSGKLGILDQSALSVLSKLIFNIFQPCLLFVNVAKTVASLSGPGNKGSVEAIYMLPLAAIFQILVGFCVGKILSFFIYRDQQESEEAKELLACSTFANSGPLPLVFTEGLFQANIDPTLVSRSAAYISLYLLGWSPLFWIIGPAILQSNSNATDSQKDPNKARKELLQRIFSPPVIGSIGGMIVGFIPFLRNLILFGNSPLNVVYEAMKTLGAAYLPAVLLVLSGSLFPPATRSSTTTTATPSSNTMDIKFLMKVTVIYLSRFLLMPLIGFSLVRLGSTVSPALQTLLSRDRLLLFVLLLETCMPSAQNTTVILQLQGNKSAATKLARTLMIIYVLGVPAISYWLIEILKLTKLAS
jgi:auxin efflux carrier family protein